MGVPSVSVGRRSFNYVWDSSVLAWVMETQPGAGGGGGSTIVTISTGSVAINGNSTVLQGTSPWVIGFQAGNVSSGAQSGNSSGLTVRPVWSSSNADQPVSATQGAGASQTNANAWPMMVPDITQTSSFTANGQSVTFSFAGRTAVSIDVTGLVAAGGTLAVTVSNDGFVTSNELGVVSGPIPLSLATATNITGNGIFNIVFSSAISDVKLTSTAWGSGTATIKFRANMGSQFSVIGTVQGDNSNAASDSGNPVKIGGKAASGFPSAVSAAQRVNAYFDLTGRQVNQAHLFDSTGQSIESSTRTAGAANSTMRGLAVRSLVTESTSVTGSVSVSSSGDITLISSAATAIYVFGVSVFQDVSSALAALTYRVLQGSTTQIWQWITPAGNAGGVVRYEQNTYVSPPAYLFRTAAGNPLLVNKGTSTTVGGLNYNLAFWRE